MREYDLATVCRWIGNSPAVAAKHYAMSTDLDADFRRAVGLGSPEAQQKAQQKAHQSPSGAEGQEVTGEPDDDRNPSKDSSSDNNCLSVTTAAGAAEWAVLDLNQ